MKSIVSGMAVVLFAAAAHAQVTPAPLPEPKPAPAPKASIEGIVVDSLHGGVLVGAEVLVQGTKANLRTDSLGRFSLQALRPGTYQVGIFHPLLDSLGISLVTKPFHVGADSVSIVALGVPSATTLISRSCTARPRSWGNSAVIGRVLDPETLQPVPHADVSVAWSEWDVGKSIGVVQTPRVIRDITDAQGNFRLCGLPSSTDASLQASRGKSQTAHVGVVLGAAPTGLVLRTLLLSAADSGAKSGNAAVSGRVVLEGSATGAGTRVELAGTEAVTITDEKGEFVLKNLPSGSHSLVARRIGYAANVVDVDLSAREPKTVTIKLPKSAHVMDPVQVTARRNAALERVGFASRRKSGLGFYLGPDRLERMGANQITDIFRTVPGLRVSYNPRGDIVESTRGMMIGGCVEYWIDGTRWRSMEPGDINMFVSGREVVAAEVYHGMTVPAQFSGFHDCAVVVLWTKMRIRG